MNKEKIIYDRCVSCSKITDKICKRCNCIPYCSKNCFELDWRHHGKICGLIKKYNLKREVFDFSDIKAKL